MAFSTAAKNQALDAIVINRISLHTGDPGTTGANLIAATGKLPVTLAASVNGERALSADVPFTGGLAGGPVTHIGFWEGDAPGTFKAGMALTGALTDLVFNAAGQYIVKAETKLTAAG